MYAIKFTGVGGRARFGAGVIPAVGETATEPRGAKNCKHGFHACGPGMLVEWFGPEVYLVVLGGARDDSADKLCAETVTNTRRIPWSAQDSAAFARWCANRAPTSAHAAHAATTTAATNAAHAAYAADAACAAAHASYAAYVSYAASAADHAAAAANAAANAADAAYAADHAAYAAERRAQNAEMLRMLRANDPTGLPEIA